MFQSGKGRSGFILQRRGFFGLNMEFGVIVQQSLDRFSLDILFIPPAAVSDDHLAELRAVISEMVDSRDLVSHRVIYFVDRVADDGTPDMPDMERLGDVRGRKLHDDRNAVSDVGLTIFAFLLQDILDNVLDEFFFRNEHVHIRVDLLDLFKQRRVLHALRDALRDQRRCFSHHFRELEARESVVAHLRVLRHFDHALNFSRFQIRYLLRDQFGNFLLKVYHSIFSFSVMTSILCLSSSCAKTPFPSVSTPLKLPS